MERPLCLALQIAFETTRIACEKSFKRLDVDTIELYYCHRVDGVTPIEKTIEAMVELTK